MVEKSVERQVTIKPDGSVEIKEITSFIENGVQVGGGIHRRVLHPGASVAAEDAEVKSYAALAHTPARVQAFRARGKKRII